MVRPDTPLRVGVITYGMLTRKSGGYLYDCYLVEQLLAQQAEVRLFAQKEPARPGSVGCLADNFDRPLLDSILSFAPHILLEDELNHTSLHLLNRKIKKLDNRIVLVGIIHHLRCCEYLRAWQWPVRRLSRFFESRFLNSLDAYIYNSYDTRESVAPLLKKVLPSVLAYPGKDRLHTCSVSLHSSEQKERRKLALLFIGNIIPRKGLHVLLTALARIPTTEWQLTVAGRWDAAPLYMRRIRQQIKRFRLEQAVTFTGYVEDNTLIELMRTQELLVVPSFMEGFGIVYLEAMGAGLPVLAGNQGGAKELVEEQVNGYLVRPDDKEAIYRIITHLVQDRTELERLKQGALATYARFPTWPESMQSIYRFLIRLMQRPDRTG